MAVVEICKHDCLDGVSPRIVHSFRVVEQLSAYLFNTDHLRMNTLVISLVHAAEIALSANQLLG